MKKTVMTIGLLSILTTSSFASNFMSLSYSKSPNDVTFEDTNGNDMQFENAQYLQFRYGSQHLPMERDASSEASAIGYYGDISLGFSDKKNYRYDNTKEELKYVSHMINVGVTYPLNNYFTLFGGVGVEGSYVVGDTVHSDYDAKFNMNGGLLIFSENYGLVIDYNSVRETIGFGLAFRL